MSNKELETRIIALERTVADLVRRLGENGSQRAEDIDPKTQPRWWVEGAGRFKDDPVFDEIVRLGREYRESLRPGAKKRQTKSTKKQPKRR